MPRARASGAACKISFGTRSRRSIRRDGSRFKKAMPDQLDAAEARALTTSLSARHSFLNHSELPVIASAFATKTGQLLVADSRELRLYAGTNQVKRTPLPTTTSKSALSRVHYNARCHQFILVYISSEVRLVNCDDLVEQKEAALQTGQMTILSSCWLDGRQELVTAGSDGTLKYFLTQRHYTVELKGRRLLSKLVPRMTVHTEWKWMSHMCQDPVEDR